MASRQTAKLLKIGVVATDSKRDEWLKQKILKTCRACVTGMGALVDNVDPADAQLEFVLTGESAGAAKVSIDLTGRNDKQSLCSQPGFYDMAIAGEFPPDDPWTKIRSLDDPKFGCVVVRPDNMPKPRDIPDAVAYTESEIFADLSRMDRVSHALIITEQEAVPFYSKLLVHRIAVAFQMGANTKYNDPTLFIPATSYGDFVNKARAMVNTKSTSKIFDVHLKHRVFAKNELRASAARNIIGTMMRKAYGDDYGFLYAPMADERLWKMATTPPKKPAPVVALQETE